MVGPVVTTFVVDPDRHRLGHPARRRDDGRRRHLVHLVARARARAHPALEAARSASCSRRPPVLLATSSASSSSARAPRSRPASSRSFGHDGPEAGIVLAIFSSARSPAACSSATCRSGRGRPRAACSSSSSAWRSPRSPMDFWWLAVTLFIAGIGIAPALAVLFAIVSASVKFSDTAEAYGWVGTGQLIGAALGSALAGFLIDGFGAQGAFWAATVLRVPRRPRRRARPPAGIPTCGAATRAPSPTPNRCRCNPAERSRGCRTPSPPRPRLSLADGARSRSSASASTRCRPRMPRASAAPRSRSGYRHLDTAAFYDNEAEVGEAVRIRSRAARRAVRREQGLEGRQRLRLDAARVRREHGAARASTLLDLYLIHWPVPSTDRYVDTWRALDPAARRGPGALHRRRELPRAPRRAHHRRDGRRTGA